MAAHTTMKMTSHMMLMAEAATTAISGVTESRCASRPARGELSPSACCTEHMEDILSKQELLFMYASMQARVEPPNSHRKTLRQNTYFITASTNATVPINCCC